MAEAFKLRTAALTTVNANVYVCPANTTAIVFMGQVANRDGANSADVTMYVYDENSAASRALVYTVPVPADAATVNARPTLSSASGSVTAEPAVASSDSSVIV